MQILLNSSGVHTYAYLKPTIKVLIDLLLITDRHYI
jgi:hypothetical protein